MDYIKKADVLKLLNRNGITQKITFSDGISIYDSVKNLPAADVAPKSEVAREIFEEIESICDDFPLYGNINTVILSKRDLAFLKKKYTEEEDEAIDTSLH